MGRKKICIKPIAHPSTRRATFEKRRIGLLKKAMELSILCKSTVSLTIYTSEGDVYIYASEPYENVVQKFQNYRGPYRLLTNDHLEQLVPGKSASNSIGFEIIKQPHTQQISDRTPTHAPTALNPIEEQENGGVAINVNVPPSPHHRLHSHSPANPQFVMPMIQSSTDSNTTCTETATPVATMHNSNSNSSSQSKDASPPTPYNLGAPFGFSAITKSSSTSGFQGGFGHNAYTSSARHPLSPYPVHTSPRRLYSTSQHQVHHHHGTEIQIKRDPNQNQNQLQLQQSKNRVALPGMSESPPKSISAEFSGHSGKRRTLDEMMMMDDIDVNLVPDFDVGGDFFDDEEQRDLAGNMDSAFLA